VAENAAPAQEPATEQTIESDDDYIPAQNFGDYALSYEDDPEAEREPQLEPEPLPESDQSLEQAPIKPVQAPSPQ
jgi:hypothetical protein